MNDSDKRLNAQLEDMETQLDQLVSAIKAIEDAKNAARETSGALQVAQETYSQATKDATAILHEHAEKLVDSAEGMIERLERIEKDLESLEITKVVENVESLGQKMGQISEAVDDLVKRTATFEQISALNNQVTEGFSRLREQTELAHAKLLKTADDVALICEKAGDLMQSVEMINQKEDSLAKTVLQISQSEKQLKTLVVAAIGTGVLAAVISLIGFFI